MKCGTLVSCSSIDPKASYHDNGGKVFEVIPGIKHKNSDSEVPYTD